MPVKFGHRIRTRKAPPAPPGVDDGRDNDGRLIGTGGAPAARESCREAGVERRISHRENGMEKSPAQVQGERQVLTHIQELVAEEHRLLGQEALGDADHARLTHVQVELDQCWDLLRQRRALRETGADPARAEIRPPDIVEKYVG